MGHFAECRSDGCALCKYRTIQADRYNIDEIVVCKPGIGLAAGGTTTHYYEQGLGYPDRAVDLFNPSLSGDAEDESLYANWYSDSSGCTEGTDTDQNRRDILRLPSIYEEARRGAAGLLLEPSRVIPTQDSVEEYLYSSFQRPSPDVENPWCQVVWDGKLTLAVNISNPSVCYGILYIEHVEYFKSYR